MQLVSGNVFYNLKKVSNTVYNNLKQLIPEGHNITFYKYDTIYFPTLRGLRPTQSSGSSNFDNNTDNYFFRTSYDYFNADIKLADKIYTGLNLYKDLNKFKRGNEESRDLIKHFEAFLSKSFFNNEDVELTATIDSDVVNVKIGKNERPIHSLGDGIQSLIILTYPLFLNKNKVVKVFIEEPEVHLHPGYQRKFIETLLSPEFKNFQYFITTHSNHFLDITIDKSNISIFSFEKVSDKLNESKFLVSTVSDSDTNNLSSV